jgi:putative CocE/NonD family hydrolase
MLYETRTDLPRQTRVVKNTWIPLADGTRLAARIWLPLDAEQNPVPGILEYIPYRKNDVYAEGDERRHGYVAAHGYACVRVDLRGSGDSDGLLEDEYLPLEQQDGVEVIAWIASQPWCSGKVGMLGLSWGGFNALQVASHAPPALKAVISLGSTDDRYEDDIHYIGGCVFARYMLMWSTSVLAYMARSPDPINVGDDWRRMWFQRLEGSVDYIDPWLSHQHYDAYWKQGSVCEDLSAIKCPIYMVGAWQDGYTNSVMRLLENYSGPCKGLIGPWGHQNPYYGVPGPAIGYLQETLRWWDYWLKGIDTGVMADPQLRFYRQDAVKPAATYPIRAGRWATEPQWPSPNVQLHSVVLGERVLGTAGAPGSTLRHRSNLVPTGDAGNWAGWAHKTEFPLDQRPEDGQSMCFDGPVADAEMEILGQPLLRACVRVDRPSALLAARLCDVAPDGTSTLITRGFLNLTHHRSRESPEPLVPGEAVPANLRLKAISYVVPAGHRLRLALQTSYWPWVWPSPEMVELQVLTGGESVLELPVRNSPAEELPVPAHFAKPEAAPGLGVEVLHQPVGGRTSVYDAATGRHITTDFPAFFSGLRLPDHGGITFGEVDRDDWEIVEGDPLSARVSCRRTLDLGRGEWQTRIEALSVMTCTHDTFLVSTTLEAFEGNVRVFTRSWDHRIPRMLV